MKFFETSKYFSLKKSTYINLRWITIIGQLITINSVYFIFNFKFNFVLSNLIIFFGIHLVPFFPKTKNALHSRMGENPYMGTFSLISLIGLLMIIFGYERAIDNLYPIYSHAYAYSEYVMFVSLTFLVAAYLPTHLKKITKHPMSIGIGIWALLHLAVNPDIISVVLFGAFLAYSILDILVAEFKKEEKKLHEAKVLYDVLSVVVGGLITSLAYNYHEYLSGVPLG